MRTPDQIVHDAKFIAPTQPGVPPSHPEIVAAVIIAQAIEHLTDELRNIVLLMDDKVK